MDEQFVDQILIDMKIEEQKRQHANKVADANVMRKETLEASVVDQLETLAKERTQLKLSGGAGTRRLALPQTICTPSPHVPLLRLAPRLRKSAY